MVQQATVPPAPMFTDD